MEFWWTPVFCYTLYPNYYDRHEQYCGRFCARNNPVGKKAVYLTYKIALIPQYCNSTLETNIDALSLSWSVI